MRIKVVQYNILNGFCQDNAPYSLTESRKKAVSKILDNEKADIVVLNEAFFWPFGVQEKVKNHLSFFNKLYSINAPTENLFRWAPIILSRFPIEWKDKGSQDCKFVKAKIKIGKKYLHLFVIHPTPFISDDLKSKAMEHMFSDNSRPELIIGDFNSLSPQDSYDKFKLIEGFNSFMKEKAKDKVEEMLKFSFLSSILKRGYKDTFYCKDRKFDYTMPTDLRSKNKNSAIRIDYILASNEIKVIDSGIIKNKLTEKASDHYPIYAILEI